MNDLEVIISRLTNELIDESEKDLIKNTVDSLRILVISEKRPQYSFLTKFVFTRNDRDEEQIEILKNNLNLIYKNCEEDNIREYVGKLLDHLQLATLQKKYIDTNLESAQKQFEFVQRRNAILGERINENIKMLDIIKTELDEVKRLKNEIYAQFVSILGIFATIIFAAFGGLNILNNILGNIKDVRVSKLFIFSSISLAGINMLLFLLLESLAKITGKNLRHCGCSYNDSCPHNVYQRHPTFMFSNLILFYIFIVGVVTYLFKIGTFVSLIKPFSVVIVIFLFALGLFIPGFFVYKYKSDPLKKKKTT